MNRKNADCYWLVPKDQRFNNWIFWRETPRRVIRSTYEHLVCRECKKIDEFEALKLEIESDVKIRARNDVVATNDGMICFRKRMQSILLENGVAGVQYIPLPSQEYYLVWPDCWLGIDESLADFQYDGEKCTICGRYRGGVFVGPVSASFTMPEQTNLICAPAIFRENSVSRVLWLLLSQEIKNILVSNHVTGVEYMPIFR